MSETNSEARTIGLKTKAVKGAGVNIVAQFLGFVCQMVGVVVLARLLNPRDFGLVAMVTAFSQWLMNFGANGFTEFIIQKQNITEKEVSSIFWLHLFLAILLAGGFTLFGGFLDDFYAESALRGIAAAMSISILLQALSTSPLALLKREIKFVSIAIVELVAVILSVVLAILAAVSGMAYWAVVTRQLTIPAVIMIGAWILCPWRPGGPGGLSKALPGLKYAFQVYGNFTLGYLTRSIDKILLGKFHGPSVLGNYDRASYLAAMPANQMLTPLNGIALATLSRLRQDRTRFSSYYTKAVSIVAYLGIMAALVLAISAEDLVLLLLGAKWAGAGGIVMALSPGIAGALVYETHSWLHLSLGTANRWLKWSLFSSALTVIIYFLAAPFGAVAMAIAYSGRTYALIAPALWYAGRPIQLGIGVVISSVWAYFASALSVGLFWLFFSDYGFPLNELLRGLTLLNRIVITSCITSFLYIALVIILQRSLRSVREILSLIPLILSRREA